MNPKEQGGFLPSSEIRKNNGKSEGIIVAFYYIEIQEQINKLFSRLQAYVQLSFS